MAAAPLPDGADVHHVEIPIDERPHRIRLRGEPLHVAVTADATGMRVWTATDDFGPDRERTFQVYPFHPSLLGRQQELPGDAVPRGRTGHRSDGWRWSLYELVDGR
ncbi:hypothetical protein [Nonomuraea jabiensis]|uniref:hypothetical protein n=1 Tax=Nonomuraea jabiensis TaxID=882448 RepID=UPI003D73B119